MDVDAVVAGFRARTLPKLEWTHEAHLAVCWAALQALTVPEALDDLRVAIRAYNDSVGTVNSETSGYHETITRYYVGAIAHVGASGAEALLAHPLCGRTAALDFWSKDRLMSVEARRERVEPDLRPLPFLLP